MGPRSILSSLISSLIGKAGTPLGPVRAGARACLRFTAWLWLLESLWALRTTPALSLARAHGLLAGLGVSLLLALPVGIALGCLLLLSSGRVIGEDPDALRRRASRWLWERDPDAQPRRVAALLGSIAPVVFYALAGFALTRKIVIGMVRPHFAAIAIVASHLLLLLVALALFPAARNLSLLFVRKIGRSIVLRWLLGRAGSLLVYGSVIGVGSVGVVLYVFWSTFAFLPWRPISSIGLGLLLTALGSVLSRSGLFARLGQLLFGAVALCGVVAIFALGSGGERAKQAMFETLSGRVGYAAALFALDFDRDGYLSVFGGGDCAPFDRRINPDAIDIPNDGRDQDCDGSDLSDKKLRVPLRRDWPVADSFPTRPNVILVTIDTFAAGHMQALGYKRAVTPKLDAFAARSAFFRYAFSQGPSTRLSFPSLFTSRWDSQIKQRLSGGHPFPIEDSELMLAEVLSAAGYDTVAVVPDVYFKKSHWGSLTQGFGRVIDSAVRESGVHNSGIVTNVALATLAEPRKKPLFLWVHYYDAHSPHQQPEDLPHFGTSHADVYDAELLLVDREVGRLLDSIEQQPGPQPLLFLTGDHGIAFDPPRHVKFNYGYDLTTIVLHVPLIVHGPSVVVRRSDEIVSTMDIAPTITNLLRLPPPASFEGASLVPELLEGRASRPDRLLHEFFLEERRWDEGDPLEQISLRTWRYDLIHDRKRGTFELYDWRKDYHETRNLADDPDRRQMLLGLKQQLALLTYELYDGERERAKQPTRPPPPPPVRPH
jgi:arylsulfatase A-like enzyme